jgi:hypothetical protein
VQIGAELAHQLDEAAKGTAGEFPTADEAERWSPPEIRLMIERKEPFRAHAFEYACAVADIDHRLTKPKHPWTNGQSLPGRRPGSSV